MVKKEKKPSLQNQDRILTAIESLRDELSAKITHNTKGIANLSDRMIHLEKHMVRLDETVMTKIEGQNIINRLDTFAQRSEDYDNKTVFYGKLIEDHESRIVHLEASPKK